MARGPESAVAACLAQCGFGTLATDIFVGELPLRPDSCIAVLPATGGRILGRLQEEQVIEVVVRDASYQNVRDVSLQISNKLHDLQGDIGGLGIIMRIRANNTPIPLGRDKDKDGGRHLSSQLFTCLLKQGRNLS
jgi:hypothetical protein